MAYHHLCSSPSYVFHDRHTLSASLKTRPARSTAPSLKQVSCLFQSKSSIQISHVSLQDPITQTKTLRNIPILSPQMAKPVLLPRAMSGSIPEAPELQGSGNCLTIPGNDVLEQDAVVVLNNMSNPHTTLLALNHFQRILKKTSREIILYNVTMKVFRKSKDLDGAEKLFDEMLQKGVKPDNVTFSTLISCARVCALPDKAVEWFQKMPTYGCDPDDDTYSAMIDAYGRAGNVDMAFNLYDRARTEKWRIDPVTFTTLIKIYGISGNYDGCLNVYEEMKALGAKPNLAIYNTLLDAMGRAKRPWQAKTIYKEMTNNGFSPNWATYATLLRAYGNMEKFFVC
ncbi:hypothetical protein QUC31_013332 [Theobroma cacao]